MISINSEGEIRFSKATHGLITIIEAKVISVTARITLFHEQNLRYGSDNFLS